MTSLDNLILKHHYGNHWRRKYPPEFEIQIMLDQIMGKNYVFDKKNYKRLVEKNRIALNFTVQDSQNSCMDVYFDVISGMPTLEQLLDSTYGSKADIRIIVYDSQSYYDYGSAYYPEDYQRDIVGLIKLNNECGVLTYLAHVESCGPLLCYTVIEFPQTGPPSKSLSELPSKRLIQEAFFWRHSFVINNPVPIQVYLKQIPITLDLGYNRRLQEVWDDAGLHFIIFNKSRSAWVKNLWLNKNEIQQAFPSCKIELVNSKPNRIAVHIPIISMNDLLLISGRAKLSYAKAFKFIETKLMRIICPDLREELDTTI